MEGALLAFAGKMDIDVRREQATWSRTDAIPFDARHRFMATLNHDHAQHAFVFVKGAPERMLAMCHDQRGADGNRESLDIDYWERKAETIAAQGQRVLAFAVKAMQPEHTVLKMRMWMVRSPCLVWWG
jgi:Cation transport ATPase